jgi:hypothetical protein
MRTRLLTALLIFTSPLISTIHGQAPTPIIVQPANTASATSTSAKPAAAVAADPQLIPAAIKLLEQIKAANEEVLAKQKAALDKLDELQDTADQLQIFAKRG